MGRLIDLDKARNEYRNLMDLTMSDTTLLHTLYGVLDNAPTVEAIPKADYENRLKADMVAMLKELKKEIEELDFFEGEEPINITQELMDEVKSWEYGVKDCKKSIQSKIDKLKEKDNGK